MNRDEFKNARSNARKANRSFNLQHNGRIYSISNSGCDRLDSSGCFDRVFPANVAMTLNHAADVRKRLKLPRACRGLVSMVRDWRLGK